MHRNIPFQPVSPAADNEKILLKDILGIVFGSVIIACGIQFIIVPAHILTGGVAGLTIILHFITSWPLWLWYVGLNVPLFIAGYKLISRRFIIYSLLGMFAVTGFLALLSFINFDMLANDILLSALLGGVINGLGVGLILHSRGSSGGLDTIAAIVNRYWGTSLGTTIFVSNCFVLGISLLTSSLQLTLYSAITMFVSSKVVNTVNTGLDTKKTVMIVSGKSEDIAAAIINKMHRGCTYLDGRGAYTGNTENIIMVTTGKTQLPQLKEIIFNIDPNSFMTINDTVEVYGKGFKACARHF